MTLSDRIWSWLRNHHFPTVHGCVWDRDCRYHGAPRRIALMWGRYMWWVDLPGYNPEQTFFGDRELTEIVEEIPASWQLLPQFGHYHRPRRPR